MNRSLHDFRKILVTLFCGAGDVVLITPLLRELRLAYPSAEMHALVMQGVAARDLLAANPSVDRVFLHDFRAEGHWASLRFCRSLQKQGYDCTITPMPHNRWEYSLLVRAIGAPNRLGFRYSMRCGSLESLAYTRAIDEVYDAHLVENNMRLITEMLGRTPAHARPKLEVPIPEESVEAARRFLHERGLSGCVLVGFHPGSGTTKNLQLKRWAPEKWAELARQVADDREVRILLFGHGEEEPLKEEILERANLDAGQFMSVSPLPILETAAIVSMLNMIIANDNLFVHLGSALQVPVVDILGPTSPITAAPWQVPHRIVRTGISCSPCYHYSKFGIRCTNERFLACLTDLCVQDVFRAYQDLLRDRPAGSCAGDG